MFFLILFVKRKTKRIITAKIVYFLQPPKQMFVKIEQCMNNCGIIL